MEYKNTCEYVNNEMLTVVESKKSSSEGREIKYSSEEKHGLICLNSDFEEIQPNGEPETLFFY